MWLAVEFWASPQIKAKLEPEPFKNIWVRSGWGKNEIPHNRYPTKEMKVPNGLAF